MDATTTDPSEFRHASDPGRYTTARVDDISPSPFNHRKVFKGLEELGDSIVAKGLIQPITVRESPPPKKGGKLAATIYELVCGERRWRAAKLRGVAHLPVIVRELSDADVLEIQLIENVQRADVHPLEEADGYRELIDKHGYTVDRIVQRTGKSRSWVYGRLKLCDLVLEVREAFLYDKISTQVALALARLPVPELQAEALAGILGGAGRDVDGVGIQAPRISEPGKPLYGADDAAIQPLTARQALTFLERRYMLDLRLAKFPTDDRTLLPDVSDCTACTYRTGNQPDLFAGEVASDDKCTRPPCFERKTAAWWERQAATAKDRGVKVLAPKETESVFGRYSGDRIVSQTFADPADAVDHNHWTDYDRKPPTWEKLLGKELLAKVPRVLVQAPSGAALELIDVKAAAKLAEDAGKLSKPKPVRRDNGEEAARKKLEQRRAVVAVALPRIAAAAAAAFRGDNIPKDSTEWWRWVASAIVEQLGSDDIGVVARTLKLDPKTARGGSNYDAPKRAILAEIASETATPAAIRYVISVCLVGTGEAAGSTWSPKYSAGFAAHAKRWKVDLDRIAGDVASEQRAAAAGAKAKKKAGGKAARK